MAPLTLTRAPSLDYEPRRTAWQLFSRMCRLLGRLLSWWFRPSDKRPRPRAVRRVDDYEELILSPGVGRAREGW
jgi:hypothetical protein